MKWIWAPILIVIAAIGYEVFALRTHGALEWSEILFQLSEIKLVLVLISWFIGLIMGHAMAPHQPHKLTEELRHTVGTLREWMTIRPLKPDEGRRRRLVMISNALVSRLNDWLPVDKRG